jgi:hypothetical protein
MYGQGPFIKRLCPVVVTEVMVEECQIVQADGNPGIIGAMGFFIHFQGTLKKLFCPGVLTT